MKKIYTCLLFVSTALFLSDCALAQISIGSINNQQGCRPYQVTLSNYSTAGNYYIWRFGDGDSMIVNTLNPVTHTYTKDGSFTPVLLGYESSGGVPSFIGSAQLDFSFLIGSTVYSSPDTACPGQNFQFYINSNYNSINWIFGNGNTASGNDIGYAYPGTGNYTVTAIINGGTCPGNDTAYIAVVVNDNVKANAQFFLNANDNCPNQPISFYPEYPGKSYSWNFGDGSTSTIQSPTHSFSKTGKYPVKLTLTNNCGNVNTSTDTAYVVNDLNFNNSYVSIYSSDTLACPGDQIDFSYNASGVQSQIWNFNDGQTSTQQYVNHIFKSIGTYAVSLKLTNYCGIDTVLHTVVKVIGNMHFPSNSFISVSEASACPGDQINFYFDGGSNSVASYLWSFDDGSSSTSSEPSHTFSSLGKHEVSVKLTNNCGVDSTLSTSVTVANNLHIANVSVGAYPSSACPGDPIGFQINSQSSGSFSGLEWNFGDGDSSDASNPIHQYAAFGTYQVSAKISNNCGFDTIIHTSVNIVSHLGFSNNNNSNLEIYLGDSTACPGDPVSFEAEPGNASSYLWNFGDGSPGSSLQYGTHTFSSKGTYTVSVKMSNGCNADTTVYSTIHIAQSGVFPTVSFTGNNSNAGVLSPACPGDSVLFYAMGGASYLWNFGDGSSSGKTEYLPSIGADIIKHVYSSAGTYKVLLTYYNGCKNSDTASTLVLITDTAGKSLNSSNNGIIVLNTDYDNTGSVNACEPVNFILFGGNSFKWSFGDGSKLTTASTSVNHSYSTAGEKNISVLVKDGCGDTATFFLKLGVVAMQVSVGASGHSISTAVNGGTPPYKYEWSNGATTTMLTNLPIGTYSLTVTDANGCTATAEGINITGIASYANELGGLKVYPNPASGTVYIEMDQVSSLTRIIFTDIVGQHVIGGSVIESSNTKLSKSFDISGFTPGVYFVIIQNEQGKAVKRLIVN